MFFCKSALKQAFNRAASSYDLQDMGDVLTQTGFADPVLDQETITLFYKTIPRLATDLKACGAHNLLQQRRKTLTGKNRWQGFLQYYEGYRNKEGYIPASCTVIYGHAWRLKPKLKNRPESLEVVIPITEIRRKGASNYAHSLS